MRGGFISFLFSTSCTTVVKETDGLKAIVFLLYVPYFLAHVTDADGEKRVYRFNYFGKKMAQYMVSTHIVDV